MAIDYSRLRTEVAERLIRENGKTAILLQPGGEPANDWEPDPAPVEREVNFVETGYSMTNRDDSLVQVGDKMGLISTEAGYTPNKTDDKLRVNGETYSFVDVQPINPGGVTMLYRIHARQ